MIDEKQGRHPPQPQASEPRRPVPVVDVQAIVAGGREAIILHEGERYRLRITANDKLILTK